MPFFACFMRRVSVYKKSSGASLSIGIMGWILLSPLPCFLISFILCSAMTQARHPEHGRLPLSKPFIFKIGIGYGIANQPLLTSHHSVIGGAVLSGSLGYRFNHKFYVDFGPVLWIEGDDIINNNAANNERPSNKRMLISFNGYYKPIERIPLQIKLGAGIGNMIYTPARRIVTADGNGSNNTEIASGVAGCAGIVTKLKLTDKIKIQPSLNFSYNHINEQKIEYNSNINHHKPSLTADFRLNFLFEF